MIVTIGGSLLKKVANSMIKLAPRVVGLKRPPGFADPSINRLLNVLGEEITT